jgi:catechol 2,3-dioxygenase-like lactoylglutathione lyase family enzyme
VIDHIMLRVNDFAQSRAFFVAGLAPLGMTVAMEFGAHAGFGEGGKPEFWIGQQGRAAPPQHIAFRARDRAAVRAFHAAALAAGGRDNGAPGLRTHYHASYYAAFVLDPDGNNIEAVCHTAE